MLNTWDAKVQKVEEGPDTIWKQVKKKIQVNMKVKVTQLCPALWDPMDCLVHGILQLRILKWVAFPFSRGSSQRIEPRSPTLQVDSFPAEPQGKPRETWASSKHFSLLPCFFLRETQKSGYKSCFSTVCFLSYFFPFHRQTRLYSGIHNCPLSWNQLKFRAGSHG